jgi:hypothetical protein
MIYLFIYIPKGEQEIITVPFLDKEKDVAFEKMVEFFTYNRNDMSAYDAIGIVENDVPCRVKKAVEYRSEFHKKGAECK